MIARLITPHSLKNSLSILITYLRNPIHGIQNLPDWSWIEILFHIALFTAATGAASGLVQTSFTSIIYGLIIIPILTIILIFIGAFFFYYFFQIFAHRSLSFRKIVNRDLFCEHPVFHLSDRQ